MCCVNGSNDSIYTIAYGNVESIFICWYYTQYTLIFFSVFIDYFKFKRVKTKIYEELSFSLSGALCLEIGIVFNQNK